MNQGDDQYKFYGRYNPPKEPKTPMIITVRDIVFVCIGMVIGASIVMAFVKISEACF